jgi:hypothetical protein
VILFLTRSTSHRRGRKANQRREAARIVSRHAYEDPILREAVNRLTPGLLAVKLQKKYGTFDTHICDNYDQGEVISDSLGRGTLQQIGVLIQ